MKMMRFSEPLTDSDKVGNKDEEIVPLLGDDSCEIDKKLVAFGVKTSSI